MSVITPLEIVLRDATVIGGVRTELGTIPLPSVEVNGSSSSLTRRCREPAGTTLDRVHAKPWSIAGCLGYARGD